jgi:hypothetical protein
MPGCGHRMENPPLVFRVLDSRCGFSTAARSPWKTLRVSHIPTAPTVLLSFLSDSV